VSRSVLAGQRIGILGANGQGKSTLVKSIARDISALGGTITEGKGLNIGYFAQQELDVLRPQDTPLEHMTRLARDLAGEGGNAAREQELRNFLGTFNFSGDMVAQSVGTMSGGEKARLVLAMIVWQRPNLLLLDEPTNHLDLATREALSMALNEFEGTVMLVSHDRALLRAVCDEFWLVARGAVQPFEGDLDDYQQFLLDEARRQREKARQQSAPPPTPAPQKRPDLSRAKPIRRELEQSEKRMEQLNAEREDLEARLAAMSEPAELADTGRRLKTVNDELHALEERWLVLQDELEKLS
jgi:ATP-binding cassette subfamily F protein 3